MINLDSKIEEINNSDDEGIRDVLMHFAHEVLELAAGNADADFNVVNPGEPDEHIEVYVINSSILDTIKEIE